MSETRKVALFTGATGRDGALLAELLLAKGYIVHCIKRRSSLFNTERADHDGDYHEDGVRFVLHYGDLTDATNLIRIRQATPPDEIYNLATQSHVQVSFESPEYTANAGEIRTPRKLLDISRIRALGWAPKIGLEDGVADKYCWFREHHCSEATEKNQ